MKRITVSVSEDVDLFFRKFASQKFKFEKGWYSEAMEDAMKLWINHVKSENNELSKNNRELWFNQQKDVIPVDLLDQIRNLSNSELIEAEYNDLSKTHVTHIQVMSNAREIKGVSSIFHLDYIETVNKLLEKGVNVKLILTEPVLKKTIELYGSENLGYVKKLISENQLEIWEIKEDVEVALTVTDKSMTLGLFINGIYDTTTLLLSDHEDALQWGDNLFKYYLKRAQKVDLGYFEELSKINIFDEKNKDFARC